MAASFRICLNTFGGFTSTNRWKNKEEFLKNYYNTGKTKNKGNKIGNFTFTVHLARKKGVQMRAHPLMSTRRPCATLRSACCPLDGVKAATAAFQVTGPDITS